MKRVNKINNNIHNNTRNKYPEKKSYSAKKKYYPKKNNEPFEISKDFFHGNLVNGMNFGNKEHELSGFVEREIIITDKYGNKKVARERQFFNSGKKLGRISAQGSTAEFDE